MTLLRLLLVFAAKAPRVSGCQVLLLQASSAWLDIESLRPLKFDAVGDESMLLDGEKAPELELFMAPGPKTGLLTDCP
jgi:hypothetical protein